MRATAAPVEGNRVRLSVELDESEIDEALNSTLKRLSREVRVPGFRPGHIPRPVLEARLGGAEVLRQQAINDALPSLYARAVADTDVDPIAAPEIDITSGEDGGPVTFDAIVEVRPTVAIPGYAGLVVTVPAIEVTEDEIQAQIDRLREQSGELVLVNRPARDGDYVTIDLHGARPGGEDLDVEDFLYEVGAGSDIPGLDEQLRGATAGDILQFETTLPGSEGGEETASVRLLLKEVKEKLLPEPTDAWAAEASEFDTLEALRADLRARMRQVKLAQAQLALREGALEALVGLVEEEPPETLVDAEVRERLHDLGHRLEERRLTLDQFLQASGRDRTGLLEGLRQEASRTVRADLALRALADLESLDVTEDELDTALADMATQAGTTGPDLRERLDRSGRLAAVRSDQRKAKALRWLLDHVEVVDDEGMPVVRDDLRIDVSMRAAGDETTGDDDRAAMRDQGERGSEDVGTEEGTTVEVEA